MKRSKLTVFGLASIAALEGCATPPLGPTIAAMPGEGRSFELFEEDQAVCKQYASQQVAGQAEEANAQAIGAGVLGTALGAGLGAAAGGGHGAAVGAAAGSVVGGGIGASNSSWAQLGIQQRYDLAYSQCMYAKGDRVATYPPAPPGYPPPAYPAPGYPPPPPY